MKNIKNKLITAYTENGDFKNSIDEMIGKGNIKYPSGKDFINEADPEGLNILNEHLKILEGQ